VNAEHAEPVDVRIEIAAMDDLDDLVKLARSMHEESALTHLPLDVERVHRTVEGAIADEKGVYCVFIARTPSGDAAGWLFGTIGHAWFTSSLVAHDHALFVLPEFRGSSAASRLLRAFCRWAGKRGAASVNVSQRVGVELERFERFMRREGFECRGMNFGRSLKPGE